MKMETPKSYKELYAELEHSTNLVILNYAIDRLAQNKEEKINLRDWLHGSYISPAKVVDYLEEMHWERYDMDENGWQQDTWMKFENPICPFEITLFYSGYYGDLELYRSDIDD